MNKKTIIKTLEKARQLLIDKGWVQGVYGDQEGKHCAVGAIFEITSNSNLENECCDALTANTKYRYVVDFNDAPGRTKKQVLGLFTRTINRLKKSK